ncbi:hypothetical protein JYU12_00300 [bacterium AH-315-K03]|nr:hypothetical protein [bacterium AH-315-K03]
MIKIAFFLSMLMNGSLSLAEVSPDVIGEAYSPDGESVLYREHHYYKKGDKHEVIYFTVDDKPFAHKELDYSSGKYTPVFRQEDTRYPEIIEVKWLGEQLLISYFAESEGPERNKTFDVKLPLVIDAGFDHFIQDNWALLLNGEKLKFYFPTPSRLMLIKLSLKSQDCSYKTDSDKCFLVSSSSWVLSLLADPIEVGYDKETKKLKRFRGLANIQDEDGKDLEVDIHYRYPQATGDSDKKIGYNKYSRSGDNAGYKNAVYKFQEMGTDLSDTGVSK